jgi:hypothetical protein
MAISSDDSDRRTEIFKGMARVFCRRVSADTRVSSGVLCCPSARSFRFPASVRSNLSDIWYGQRADLTESDMGLFVERLKDFGR